jgi:4-amino-4-deoxy-L-arabinose transferase-like glycosyltransferase
MTDLQHTSNTSDVPRTAILLTAMTCLLAIAFVYCGRLLAPNDLFRKDQSKTMAYTVDIVLNNRYSLPRDSIFQPATKPPLYNWFAAAFVGPTGIYDEWAQKLPSVVGGMAVAGLIFGWCRRNFRDTFDRQHALLLAMFAGTIWVASRSTMLLIYIARPDMLQAFFLVGAWLAGHAALKFAVKRDARRFAALFWLCVTAAAMTKGPAAVYPIAYVLLAAPLIFGNWRRIRNLYWIPGLVFLLGSVGLWLWCAARQDWPHVRDVLLGSEVAKRIATSRVEGGVKPVHYSLMWFIQQNTVWSYLMLGSMGVTLVGSVNRVLGRANGEQARRLHGWLSRWWKPSDGFFISAAGAANLWAIVVVVCLSIPKDKRMDFLLPAYPAAAILAAHFVVWLVARFHWARFAIPLGGAILLLDEKRSVGDAMVYAYAALSVVLIIVVERLLRHRPTFVWIVAAALTVGFLLFEVLTNTKWGVYKTSPGLTYAAMIGGAGIVAALWLAALRRFRFELPLVALGVIVWGYALLQNLYKETGVPARNEGSVVRQTLAKIYNRDPKSTSTNPSVYAARFAKEAAQIVGDDKVVMIIRSKSPIMTLMGRHQGSYLTREDFQNAKWVIAERSKFRSLIGTPQEALYSGRLDIDFGHIAEGGDIYKDRVALYRIENGVPSVDEMISIHRWATNWTTADANPYRSPNTGWIEGPNDPPIWTPPPGDPWLIPDVRKRKSAE